MGVTFDLVPVAITAIGDQRTTCFPQIEYYTPAFVAAHRRTAVGNQQTTCFPQIAHYTPALVAFTVVEVSLLPPYAAPASLRTGSHTGQPPFAAATA